MGWLTRSIDAGKDYRNSLEDVADGLFVDLGNTRAKVSQFWVLLVLARPSPPAASSATPHRR